MEDAVVTLISQIITNPTSYGFAFILIAYISGIQNFVMNDLLVLILKKLLMSLKNKLVN